MIRAPEGDAHVVSQTLLLVDDDASFRERMARALVARGLRVTVAGTIDEALALTEGESPELASVDLKLPSGSGLTLVRALHRRDPTTRIVVLTGFGSIATALDAVRLGAVHYLTKPVDADELLDAFHRDERGPGDPSRLPLDEVEREHVERVMAECGGNVTHAARVLGIHRRSLQRKLGRPR